MITPVTKAHPNPIPNFWLKLSLDGELTVIDELGKGLEMILGMRDGASGKLGLGLVIERKLGSLLEIEVGNEVGTNDGVNDGRDDGDGVNDGVKDGVNDGWDDGKSVNDGLELGV